MKDTLKISSLFSKFIWLGIAIGNTKINVNKKDKNIGENINE